MLNQHSSPDTFVQFNYLPTLHAQMALTRNDAVLNMLKAASEDIQSEDVALMVVRPDLSNPPDDIASVAPSFWRPAPVAPQPTPGKAPAKK